VCLGADRYAYDRIVCNAPPAAAERSLLPDTVVDRSDGYWDEQTWGPSAYMCYLGVSGDVDPLAHHTLVLPTDWDPHFESIFETARWPEHPACYVNVPSKTDPSVAPDGCETVVVLVPVAPGLEDTPERREACREHVLETLASTVGVDLRDRILFEHSIAISDFTEQFDRPQGTALGLAHTLRQTGPLRPSHRASGVDNLYYVGGDTNPGIGVPMCLLSGEHVTDAVRADAAGTGSWLPSLRQ